MVCSRGKSPTHHMKQIKLFNAIAAAAVIGASLITAAPAESSILLDIRTSKEERRNDGVPYYIRKEALGNTKETAT